MKIKYAVRVSGLAKWLTLAILVFVQPVLAAIQTAGSVTSTSVSSDPVNGNKKVTFGLSTGGQLEVSVFAEDVIRVRFHWDGIWSKEDIAIAKGFSQWPSFNPTLSDEGGVYRISTPAVEVEVVKSPIVKVHFKSPQGFYLSQDDKIEYETQYNAVSDGTYDNVRYTHTLPYQFKLKNIRVMPAGEAYFGLGEYAGPMNRRNRDIQMWNADTFSWQEGWTPMYMTMPIFYGTQGAQSGRPSTTYGIFFNNPARPVFRMGTQSGDRYSFEAGDGQIDYFFFSGGATHQMRNVISRYTELTGRPTMLPKWAFGYHLSRWSYDNQSWIEWLAQEFRNRDFPLDAIYIDLDYMDTDANGFYEDGTLRQLTFNYKFPNVGNMINYAGQRGVKLIPLVEPWLSTGDNKWGEAAGMFHFIKDYNMNQMITPIYFGSVSWLDFSSTPTRDWWKNKLLGFLNAYPLAGIWNDLNEPADNEAIPRNGQYYLDGKYPNQWDSRRFHLNEKNVYNIRETSLTYDALLTKYPTKRPFVLSRAGYPGIQRYALGWSGDNVASWDHCRHNIGLGVSVMMSGQANFGHDVGGFVGNPSAELLTRWHEWASMTPFFRSHSIKGNDEREPWRYGSYYEGLLRNIIKFRYRLMPYMYTLAYQSSVSGIPMNTPAVMHFQNDPQTHHLNDNDFMLGDFLLVSPVYEAGKSERWTYLPAGANWYNFYNGTKHSGGGWVSQPAPVGTLPLYARAGAIIPMGPSMAYANQVVADFMDINVWPNPTGYSTEFSMHEDDGETWNFLAGNYARTRFVNSSTASNFTFVITAREGSYETGTRNYFVKIRDVDAPTSVSVNGQAIPYDASFAQSACYSYDAATRRINIKVPDTRALTTIVVSSIPGYIPLTWVGNISNFPTNGAINPADNFWVNAESSPKNAGESAEVIYSTDSGANWTTVTMNPNGTTTQNDKWNRNLGTFALNTPVWYWVRITDSQNLTITNNNGGAFYKSTVGVFGPALTWIGSSHNYPTNGAIKSTDNFWVNTYTFPQNAAQLTQVVISTNEGASWATNVMNKSGVNGADDWWNKNLSTFANGTKIWYWLRATDGYGTTKIDMSAASPYKVTVGVVGPAISWAGNQAQYPVDGSVQPTSDFWLNVESFPKQAGVLAQTVISTNLGVTWITNTMNLAGAKGNNDWWNKNLGKFPNGTKIWYWMKVTDSQGTIKTVNNSGNYYKTISGVSTPALVWAGNLEQFPAGQNLKSTTDLWLNVESWPKTAGVSATIFYTIGGNSNELLSMNLAGARGNNDWWNINLGKFGAGTTVLYFIDIVDSNGTVKRVPAEGMASATVALQ